MKLCTDDRQQPEGNTERNGGEEVVFLVYRSWHGGSKDEMFL